MISSNKIEEEENEKRSFGLESSGKMDFRNFGFMRGESSFTSYRSRSRTEKSQADMMGNLE